MRSLCQLGQFVKSDRQVFSFGASDDLAALYSGKELLSQEFLLNLKLLQNALVLSCSPGSKYNYISTPEIFHFS